MKITFRLVDEKEVEVINEGRKVIGRIFTPAGTSEDRVNAIQVCGFDDCFELWGCGIFGDGEGNAKKDIQLLFKENSQKDNQIPFGDVIGGKTCGKCFSKKNAKGECKCDDLRVKSLKELVVESLEVKE